MNANWKHLTVVPCLVSSLLATPVLAANPQPAAGSEQMAQLLAEKAPGRDTLQLDLSDKAQYDFVVGRLLASGNTPENSPRLFERLKQARKQALKGADMSSAACNQSIDLVQEPALGTSLFTAKALVGCQSANRDYVFADVRAFRANADGSGLELLAQRSAEDYTGGGNFDAAGINFGYAQEKGKRLQVDSLVLSFNDATGAAFGSYSLTYTDGAPEPLTQATLDYFTIEQPKEITGGAPIRLCINRGLVSGNIDCDYGSVVPSGNALWPRFWPETENPYAMAADVGGDTTWSADPANIFAASSAWDFSKTYMPLQGVLYAGSTDTAGNCSIQSINSAKAEMFYLGGDAACGYAVNALVGTAYFPGYIATGGNAGSYKLLADFGSICTGYEKQLKMRVTINYVRKCGTTVENRIKIVTKADPIDFRNSCFAEDTRIQMADGSTKPVQSVQVGEKVVADAQGTVLTVTGFARGGEVGSMFRIKSDKGQEIEVTAKHPVLTDKGVVTADNLRVKDTVMTSSGKATLTSVTRVPVKSLVYNLEVGTPEELARVGKQTTVFANGFLMGDHRMQVDLADRNATSVASRGSVSKAWMSDYRNDVARGARVQ